MQYAAKNTWNDIHYTKIYKFFSHCDKFYLQHLESTAVRLTHSHQQTVPADSPGWREWPAAAPRPRH